MGIMRAYEHLSNHPLCSGGLERSLKASVRENQCVCSDLIQVGQPCSRSLLMDTRPRSLNTWRSSVMSYILYTRLTLAW